MQRSKRLLEGSSDGEGYRLITVRACSGCAEKYLMPGTSAPGLDFQLCGQDNKNFETKIAVCMGSRRDHVELYAGEE